MKILMLVPFLPNTSMSGGQTRWYNIIKYLSKEHEITLFSLIKEESERRFIPELENYCTKVLVFKRPKSPWTARSVILSVFGPFPLLMIRNWSFSLRQAIKHELEKEKFDLIHAETFYVMPHLPNTQIPTLLVDPTIEYKVYKHYVDNEVISLLKPFFLQDVIKLKFWEKYYWNKATKLVAVSEEDKHVMETDTKGKQVSVIPNGIDAEHFKGKKIKRKIPKRVLFVGNFKWLQNIEAVDILIEKIWPGIRNALPNAKLWLVGMSIPSRLHELAKKRNDIEVTEAIEDIREAYKSASVMTVPLRGPGGTRLKVLEAFASSLPVVSTSVGVAGLEIEKGKHALVADSNLDLANETVKLLKNKKLANTIGNEGRTLVKKKYDWKNIVKLHDSIYKEILMKK